VKRVPLRLTLVGALIGICLLVAFSIPHSTKRSRGRLSNQAYVWQRAWTPAVQSAVRTESAQFTELVYLAAEINFTPHIQIARVSPDFKSMASSGHPVGVALRIGAYHGKLEADDAVARELCELAQSVVDEAKAGGLKVAELQVDFDCPEAKLDGYRIWISAIKHRLAPTPVVITALPSWLKREEFKPLAAEAGSYVLQVHSLEKPSSIDAPMTLCDPAAARRAVEQAGRIGIPFRVALPTYGYRVAFDQRGKFVGLGAETMAGIDDSQIQTRELGADPIAMAGLVRTWTSDRPASLIGVIWYRLPVNDDTLNWRWDTLQMVIGGRDPVGKTVATVRETQPCLFDVELANCGDADTSVPKRVIFRWRNAELVAVDSLAGFDHQAQSNSVIFEAPEHVAGQRLAPGDRLPIGWLRLSADKEVHADASTFKP